MTSTAEQYEAALHPLTALIDAVPKDGWDASSPCEGWTGRDVVTHMVETQREMLLGHGVDLGTAPDLEADPVGAWRDHTERVLQAVTDEALAGRSYDSYFGPTTVGATLEQFYVWDMYVHRWDLARAADLEARLTDDELDRIEQGADGFGDALYMEGICRPSVQAPTSADRATRVLARLGRVA